MVVQWCAADSLDCDVDIALGGVKHASDHLVIVDNTHKGVSSEDFVSTAAIDEVGLVTKLHAWSWCHERQAALIAIPTSPSAA